MINLNPAGSVGNPSSSLFIASYGGTVITPPLPGTGITLEQLDARLAPILELLASLVGSGGGTGSGLSPEEKEQVLSQLDFFYQKATQLPENQSLVITGIQQGTEGTVPVIWRPTFLERPLMSDADATFRYVNKDRPYLPGSAEFVTNGLSFKSKGKKATIQDQDGNIVGVYYYIDVPRWAGVAADAPIYWIDNSKAKLDEGSGRFVVLDGDEPYLFADELIKKYALPTPQPTP